MDNTYTEQQNIPISEFDTEYDIIDMTTFTGQQTIDESVHSEDSSSSEVDVPFSSSSEESSYEDEIMLRDDLEQNIPPTGPIPLSYMSFCMNKFKKICSTIWARITTTVSSFSKFITCN